MRRNFLMLAALVLPSHASFAATDDRLTVPAVRIDADIRVDGILDEPEWQSAAPITGFRLIDEREGQMPAESTEVRVLFDADRVYVGIWCGNRAPGAIRSNLAPRDEILDDDHVAVHFDTYRDRRRAYIFGVNADGVQIDGILDGGEPDFSWDAVWSAEAKRVMGGWVAEIAIPVREMRFPAGGGAWGLWFRRQIMKNDEVCSWPLWKQENQGAIMLQAADLTGLEGLVGSGGIEVQPYATITREDYRGYYMFPPGVLRSTDWAKEYSGRAGLDLKYGITSTLVANATFNPDYSQVEADALQIDTNQRFALFYPEKRPFFLEGAEIFDTDLDLVYTRRIADPDAGLKITGKEGKVRMGAIAAYDGGGGSLAGAGALGHEPVSREGFVGIGRMTLDLGEDNHVGLLYTDRRSRNELNGADGSIAFGPPAPIPQGGANSVYAVDGLWRLAKPLFMAGQLAWSHTRVDSSSDYEGQRIASRGTHGDLGYNAELRYADGIREIELYQRYFGPEFRTEAGFVPRVDMRETGFDSDFIVRPENAWLRSWQSILTAYLIHDHAGGLEEWWVSPMIDWVFQKSTHAHTMYVRSMERFLGREFDLNTYILNVDNSRLRQVSLAFYSSFGDGVYYDAPTPVETFRGWRERYTFEATLRPSSRVTSALTAVRSRFSREFGGEEIFDIWVMGANTTYQFTRRLYARVYPQYDTGDDHFDADFLLGYVVSPGTVLYAGYNGDFDRIAGRSRATQRSWFLKASYRFMR